MENLTPPPPTSPKPDRTMPMLCHLASFAAFVIPLGNVLGPLIVWMMKKDQDPDVDRHGRASMNFQITTMIVFLAMGVVAFFVGFLPVMKAKPAPEDMNRFLFTLYGTMGAFVVYGLISMIQIVVNALRANDGKPAYYWPAIPFFRSR